MNEFTKEELFDLKYAIEKMRQPGKDILGFYKLQEKIQSMIDNLPKCDHRSGIHNYNENGKIAGYSTDIYRCRYCDKLFKFLYQDGTCIGHEDLE